MKKILLFIVLILFNSCDFKRENKFSKGENKKTIDTLPQKEKIELRYNLNPKIDDYLVSDESNCQTIKDKCLLFISPTDKQIDKMKNENVNDYYTIADDINYYFSLQNDIADSLLINKKYSKKRKFKFITSDNEAYIIDLDRNDRGKLSEWLLIGFNPQKKPVFIDVLESDFSYMKELFDNPKFYKTSINENLLIDYIYKCDEQDDFYLALYLRENYSKEILQLIENSTSDTVFSNLESTRLLLNDSIANKHLNTDGTEELIVFDKNQEIIDTIQRKQFETYEGTIDSYNVATYNFNNRNYLNRYLVISSQEKSTIEFYKGKKIKVYSEKLSKKLLTSISYNTDYLYSAYYFMNKKDTIKFISFADYQKGGEKLYLFQNSILKDSLINSFVIREITPVPIVTENEFIFLSSVGIPETDALWDLLTGIDKKKIKFTFYEDNRLSKIIQKD